MREKIIKSYRNPIRFRPKQALGADAGAGALLRAAPASAMATAIPSDSGQSRLWLRYELRVESSAINAAAFAVALLPTIQL